MEGTLECFSLNFPTSMLLGKVMAPILGRPHPNPWDLRVSYMAKGTLPE